MLAAHFGLDLVPERVIARTMEFIVEHESDLARMIDRCHAARLASAGKLTP